MNVEVPIDWVTGFALALTRLLGVFMFAPVFAHTAVPTRVRLGIALALAWFVAPHTPVDPMAPGFSLGLAVVQEVAIGASLGLAASIVFAGFSLVGEIAGMQGGLGAAAVLDPVSGANSVVLSSLIGNIAGFVFLATSAHHEVLRGVFLSFEALPLGGGIPASEGFANLARLGAVVFEVGVRLAAPFTAVMLVSNVAVGMLGRAIPQLNLISLQLPAQIGLTLLILGLAAGAFVDEVAATLEVQIPRAVTALWKTP